MRIRAIVCRQCGAPLDPPMDVDAVCCEYCGLQFRPNTRIGPPIDRVEVVAHVAALTLAERKILNELDELDGKWESKRGGFLRRKADDCYHVPEPKRCCLGALIAAIAGPSIGGMLLWVAVADGAALGVMLASIVLTIGLLCQARVGRVYQQSLADYRSARHELLERLNMVRNRVCEESRA